MRIARRRRIEGGECGGLRLAHDDGASVAKLRDERGFGLTFASGVDGGSEFGSQSARFVDIFHAERNACQWARALCLLWGHFHPGPQRRFELGDPVSAQGDEIRR
jgi:hypothetical protein